MPGKVIGKKLNYGYVGQISRQEDAIVVSRPADGEIVFGQAVIMTSNNKFKAFGTGNTDADFRGFALREVKQATLYESGIAKYTDNETTDVLVRGSLIVKVNAGEPTSGGKVYIRVANGSDDKPLGGVEAEADSTNTVELSNVIFNTGKVDANGVAEVTVINRKL